MIETKENRITSKYGSAINTAYNVSGVTLMALIITIAVLAILAGVSITMLGDNGIVEKAKKASEKAEETQNSTSEEIKDLVDELGEPISDWTQQEDGSIKKGKTVLQIGDYVNYNHASYSDTYSSTYDKTGSGSRGTPQVFKNEDYKYGWRVLGVDEKGNLLLFAEAIVEPSEGGYADSVTGRTFYRINGKNGWANIETELNNICSIYGHGKGAAGARSINADDINKAVGYDPKSKSNYGKEGVYTYDTANTKYTLNYDNQGEKDYSYSNLGLLCYRDNEWKDLAEYCYDEEGNIIKEKETITFANTVYNYLYGSYVDKNSKIYEVLFKDKLLVENDSGRSWYSGYFLATHAMESSSSLFSYDLLLVSIICKHQYTGRLYYDPIVTCDGSTTSQVQGVKPIVMISPSAKLIDSGETKDGCKVWNIE